MLSSPCPLPQGMMGAYGPPYMPMQGPHEGLLSVAPMPPHPAGGPHLPPHHLQQGMPGYPGMLHQGKGHCPSNTCSVTSSRVSPAGGVYLVHRLHSLIYSPSSQSSLVSNKLSKCTPMPHLKYVYTASTYTSTDITYMKINQTNIQLIFKT